MTLVDVKAVEGNRHSRFVDKLGNLVDLVPDGRLEVVPSSCELDMVAGLHDGRNEACANGARRHTGNHERRLRQEAGERRVDVDLAVARPDEARAELVRPAGVAQDGRSPGLLARSGALASVPEHNGADPAPLPVANAETPDPARAAGAEVERMGRRRGECGSLRSPVDGFTEDEGEEGGKEGEGRRGGAEVGAVKGVEDGEGEGGRGPEGRLGGGDGSDGTFGGSFEERGVVGDADGEETHREDGKSLRVGDLQCGGVGMSFGHSKGGRKRGGN